MHKFDKYINLIVKGLKTSKSRKQEIADEFRDHLEMLKQEYMKEGFSEEQAVDQAIKSFGSIKKLKPKLKKVHTAIINYLMSCLVYF